MATNWIVLSSDADAAEAQKWLASSVLAAASELNAAGEGRLEGMTGMLQAVVDRVRAAVVTGNRTALSLTPNAVPPEARQHVWAIVVYELVESQPNLGDYALKDGYTRRWERSEKWVEGVRRGEVPVTPPTDPDPDHTPANDWGDYSGAEAGGVAGAADLATDGPAKASNQ